MNIKQDVYIIAGKLLVAAESGNAKDFGLHYATLLELANSEEALEQKEPALWEALADFTENMTQAEIYYKTAFDYAQALVDSDIKTAKNHLSSIALAMALMCEDQERVDDARQWVEQAKEHSSRIKNQDLKDEIKTLYVHLLKQ